MANVRRETGEMLKLSHKTLDVWNLSVNFVTSIYQLTENFPKSELNGIVSQIRRAAVSIASNIAEGASRISSKEKTRFYIIARSSLVEIDTQLEIAKRLEYCSDKDLRAISEQLNHLFAMLSKMIGKQ